MAVHTKQDLCRAVPIIIALYIAAPNIVALFLVAPFKIASNIAAPSVCGWWLVSHY